MSKLELRVLILGLPLPESVSILNCAVGGLAPISSFDKVPKDSTPGIPVIVLPSSYSPGAPGLGEISRSPPK